MDLSIDLLEFLNANSYEQSMFRKAIYNSDKKLMSKLIKTHSSLKDQVLHVAAHLGNINILKEYIHAGADVNKIGAEEENCFTPLQRAVSENQFHAVKWLVQTGANVNADYQGRCHGNCLTLNIAINNYPENLEMIDFLLNNGADVNKSCDRCYTPLIKAIQDHQQEIIQVLLKFDADVNLSCNYFGDKVTPLYMAAKQNQLETVKVLLSRNANVQAITANRNQSVLHGAIPLASQEVVECLLSAGVDLNIVDSSDKTVVDLGRHTNYRLIPTIKEHLVKMKAAGLHLSERNLEVINHQEFDKVLDSCSKEVELMKKFRIAHTRASVK
ncbi:putative ankyrin repeat protein RF_0381 [Cotesia glomerata]|uniref:putative ankyrin repeat protein RF_0381 n=1 Tax=Cotesia glomerata TaxID=32391 RepID=UPI001D02C2B0|nr:putative ankyrin repeat protein RF_0381 [Cotesia glomerata]